MKQILLTKFAVSFAPDNPRQRFEHNEGWLDERMGLFKKYCLPSVQAQSIKDFDWWFIASPNFKNVDRVVPELEKYGKMLWIEAPWKDGQDEVGEALEQHYRDTGWIATTRMDSDDIIKDRFMEYIQLNSQERECWLSFFLGYYLYNDLAMLARVPPNPFVTYVENSYYGIKSVFHVDPHINIEKHAIRFNEPLIDIGNSIPAWVHVFHGNNIKSAKTDPSPWPELGRGSAEHLLKAHGFTYE